MVKIVIKSIKVKGLLMSQFGQVITAHASQLGQVITVHAHNYIAVQYTLYICQQICSF